MSVAFYRKYRSKKLSEVVGQKHITEVLEKSLEKNRISHAYLFTGPRGVGKTSIARILAHEINKIPYNEEDFHPDIIEIDAASNNGVDEIRNLREQIQVAPFSAKYRIYIIDEVHMLSKAAFNALLKTLEEPPAHAIFILATTDAHKLPATIISRTQQFVFHFISKDDVVAHLNFISKNEKIDIEQEALEIIAERGGGSFRDSISLLDQISSVSNEKITAKKLEQILGLAPKKQILAIIKNYETQNIPEILNLIGEIQKSGVDLKMFVDQFITEIKNILAQKPHLVKLLTPLNEAKNSNFLEIELLSILIIPGDFSLPPVQVIKEASISQKTEVVAEAPISTPPIKKTKQQPASEKKPTIDKSPEDTPTQAISTEDLKKFKWSDFVHATKAESIAIGTTLGGRAHEISNNKILIFAEKSLHKNQLSSTAGIQAMGNALKNIGAGNWQIEIIGSPKPPEDPEMAKVFEIMGGGEEVQVDE